MSVLRAAAYIPRPTIFCGDDDYFETRLPAALVTSRVFFLVVGAAIPQFIPVDRRDGSEVCVCG